MTSILFLFTSLGLFRAEPKVMPAELARIIAESSAVVIATPSRNPLAPHIERIVCNSGPFSSSTNLRFSPPLSISDRETEETFGGVNERLILFLHQAGGTWDLASRHFGWISLAGHKVRFRRFSPGFDPLKHYSGDDFLEIENDLLLPGNLVNGEHGSLSEKVLLTWVQKAFAASHRR